MSSNGNRIPPEVLAAAVKRTASAASREAATEAATEVLRAFTAYQETQPRPLDWATGEFTRSVVDSALEGMNATVGRLSDDQRAELARTVDTMGALVQAFQSQQDDARGALAGLVEQFRAFSGPMLEEVARVAAAAQQPAAAPVVNVEGARIEPTAVPVSVTVDTAPLAIAVDRLTAALAVRPRKFRIERSGGEVSGMTVEYG